MRLVTDPPIPKKRPDLISFIHKPLEVCICNDHPWELKNMYSIRFTFYGKYDVFLALQRYT